MQQLVNLTVTEGVARVTLNHPPVNALSRSLVDELEATFRVLVADDSVRAVVLCGAGPRTFAAGADISEFLAFAESGQDPVHLAARMQRVFDLVEGLAKPVIAAIHGHCLGGGLELALACDLRFASESALLGLPEVRLGIIPGAGGTQRLSRLVGKTLAKYLILAGDPIDAHEAWRIGLVNQVVPGVELLPATESLARRLAAGASVALAAAKRAIDEGYDLPLAEGQEAEARCFRTAFQSEDMREGVQAFLEKRPACFRGR